MKKFTTPAISHSYKRKQGFSLSALVRETDSLRLRQGEEMDAPVGRRVHLFPLGRGVARPKSE